LSDTRSDAANAGDFLQRGGLTGSLIRDYDWAATGLGPIESWPQSLKTAVGMVVHSTVPIVLLWGPDGIMIYNDAYSRFAGARHPQTLGAKVREAWVEVADFNDNVMRVGLSGGTLAYKDQELTLYRHGIAEQVWMNLDYSPVLDERGVPAGVIAIVVETTARVLADRRNAAERDRLRKMFEQAPGFMALFEGPNHVFTFANAAYMHLIGPRDVIGKPVREVLPEVAEQGFFDWLDECYTSATPFFGASQRVSLRRAGGEIEDRFVDFVYQPIVDETGVVTGLFLEGSDVTDRVRSDAALRESEARFREVADAAPVLIWITDTTKGCIFLNQPWMQFTGRSMSQELGYGWVESMHPDDVENCLAIYHAAFDRREPFRMDYRLKRHDGSYRVIDDNGVPRFAADGVFLGYIGSCVDVTEARGIEAELRRWNETLEARVEERTREHDRVWVHSRDLLVVVGANGIFRAVSPAWTQTLGHSIAEVVGRSFIDFIHPDDAQQGQLALQSAAAGNDLNKFEDRYLHKDGSVRWLSWHTSLEGGLVYAYGRDITNEKIAAEELEQSAARLRAIFETNHQFQGLLTLDGILLDANKTSLTAIDCTRAEVVGKPFWDSPWFSGTPAVRDVVREAVARAASGQIVRQEIHVNLPVGGWRWFDFALRPVFDSNSNVFAIVPEAIELTERRNAEEALRQSQKMEVVGQLTGGIAHDFNNLLAGISGSLELLEARVAQGRVDGMERYIGTAQASVMRAAALTQRLLAFSRRQTLDPKTTDINRLITDMADLIRRTMGPAIEVEVVGAGGLWLTKVDASQLENALLNLCVNARDAMPDGGRLTIETANKWLDEHTARGHDLSPGQYVCLSVTDTGTGMGSEVIQHAFEPFFTTKPLGQGTGLGLSMIYGFVRQSEGQVRIYSEIDKGTTLSLYLPRFVGSPDIEQPTQFSKESADGYGETVLVIDDEPTIRELIVEVLESAGYVALSAPNGAEGLKIIKCDVRIDLLITDVGLPGGMNGRQVADAAREIRPGLKTLFITGYAENAAVGNGHLDHGMQLLTKPFALATLAGKIREMVES